MIDIEGRIDIKHGIGGDGFRVMGELGGYTIEDEYVGGERVSCEGEITLGDTLNDGRISAIFNGANIVVEHVESGRTQTIVNEPRGFRAKDGGFMTEEDETEDNRDGFGWSVEQNEDGTVDVETAHGDSHDYDRPVSSYTINTDKVVSKLTQINSIPPRGLKNTDNTPNQDSDGDSQEEDGGPTTFTYGCPRTVNVDRADSPQPCSGTIEVTKDYGDHMYGSCPECDTDVMMERVSSK